MALLSLLLFLPSTLAYTWSFQNTPQQCQNLTIAISGDDGKPPYRVLIIPFGPTPLPNAIEARKIVDVGFSDGARSVSFMLKFPENSQFVAVVSDATGFGSGGTSVAAQVTSSSDASCFDAKTNVSPLFYFSIDPPNQIVQCQDTRIYWNPPDVNGTPSFVGIIPGGQSFSIPEGNITTVQSLGTGFTWKPSLRSGTTLILAGGDDRGNGTGGSILNVVSAGTNMDSRCLSGTSPSSTPGSPAGGSYPTGSGSWTSGSSHSSSNNVGIIVGIALGTLAFLIAFILIFWFIRKRQNNLRRAKERPVDLMYGDEDGEGPSAVIGTGVNELPEYYQPEPFMMQASDDPASISRLSGTSGEYYGDADGYRRPLSGGTQMTAGSMYASTRVTTPDNNDQHTVLSQSGRGTPVPGAGPSSARRKGGVPRPLRPVNIIQHDDAGPPPGSSAAEGEPDTIELPPTYEAVKKNLQGQSTPLLAAAPDMHEQAAPVKATPTQRQGQS